MNTWDLCQQLSNYWREWFGLPTHGAVFLAYQPVNQTPTDAQSSSWTSTHGPMTTQKVSPTSQQIPTPILQLAWLLFSLTDQNLDQNADLIDLLNTSTSGSFNDLNGESLDRDVLSDLSVQLSIMSNILAQSHAANQEIPDDLADDSTKKHRTGSRRSLHFSAHFGFLCKHSHPTPRCIFQKSPLVRGVCVCV